MDHEFSFENLPFGITSESAAESAAEEAEWGRRAFPGRRPGPGIRSRPPAGGRRSRHPPPGRPRPSGFGPRRPWGIVLEPFPVESPSPDEPTGSERVRWIQDCLNQAMGLQIPVTGVMGPETRSAIRSFQRRQGLRPSGIVGPDTDEVLHETCRGVRSAEESEAAWAGEVSFAQAINDPKANGPGIYTLYKGGRRIYVGQSQNLKRRLQQHLWCLTHMDVEPGHYRVKLTPMTGAGPEKLRRVESAVIEKWKRRKDGGALANIKKEQLAEELWGEAWN